MRPTDVEPGRSLSIRCTEGLLEAGIESSVGAVGNSSDNAMAETIHGLHEAEVLWHDGPRRGFEDVELATLDWVDGFNNRRLLVPIGNVPPAEDARAYENAQRQADSPVNPDSQGGLTVPPIPPART